MKKVLASLAAMALLLGQAGCGSPSVSEAGSTDSESASAASESSEEAELVIFAAASMTETLEQIKTAYEADNPGIRLVFTFDSSGTLKTQIEEGAYCDLFVSAAQKQMDQLAELELIDVSTRVDLLENKVTLVVPKDNPAGLLSFDDLAEQLKRGEILLAMGNSDVPVGQYTEKILAFYGLSASELAEQGLITYGSNVKEVVTQVREESVKAGVVYATDAASAGLTVVDTAEKEMCGQVIYPAAVLKDSRNAEAAKAFLAYLQEDAAMKIFASVGFSRAE